MVSFSWMVTTTEEVVLVGVVAMTRARRCCYTFTGRRWCNPSTYMAIEGDGGGRRWQAEVGGS
jgi:hypothetical protein